MRLKISLEYIICRKLITFVTYLKNASISLFKIFHFNGIYTFKALTKIEFADQLNTACGNCINQTLNKVT